MRRFKQMQRIPLARSRSMQIWLDSIERIVKVLMED